MLQTPEVHDSTKKIEDKDGSNLPEESKLNKLSFHEDYFYRLATQGNIYSINCLKYDCGKISVLTPSFHRKLVIHNYNDGYNYDEIPIPSVSLPHTISVIAMDFYSQQKCDSFIFAIAFIKKEDVDSNESYLNIYPDWRDDQFDDDEDEDFTNILECSIKLSFMPFKLQHTIVPYDPQSSRFLLAGSDFRIHSFKSQMELCKYEEEEDTKNIFPEFENLVDIPLNFIMHYKEDFTTRQTVVFGDAGNVLMFYVDLTETNSPLVTAKKHLHFEYPVSCGQFFSSHCIAAPSEVKGKIPVTLGTENSKENPKLEDPLDVVVSTSLEGCFVMRGIFGEDFCEAPLPQSENFDVVTCCLICDVNCDGKNEILLGTYGQTVLIYEETEKRTFNLLKILPVAFPVLNLFYEDFTGGGVKQLIVVTSAGVHIFSHDAEDLSVLVLRRLKSLVLSKENDSKLL